MDQPDQPRMIEKTGHRSGPARRAQKCEGERQVGASQVEKWKSARRKSVVGHRNDSRGTGDWTSGPGSNTHSGSDDMTSPVAAKARDREPPQIDRNRQRPHLPASASPSRNWTNMASVR